MKILLLNPNVDAQRKIYLCLKNGGVAVLAPMNPEEALQTLQLHGSSVDLAIIHREGLGGQGEPGLDFIKKVKADPTQADLPILVTHEKWTDAQAAEHQAAGQGANAYLTYPFTDEQLKGVIEAVLGQSLSVGALLAADSFEVGPAAPAAPAKKPPPIGASLPKAPPASAAPAPQTPAVQEDFSAPIRTETASLQLSDEALADPSVMFSIPKSEGDSLSIQLAAPEGSVGQSSQISLASPNLASGAPMTLDSPVADGPVLVEPPSDPASADKPEGTLKFQLASDEGLSLERPAEPGGAGAYELPVTLPPDRSLEMPSQAGSQSSLGSGLSMVGEPSSLGDIGSRSIQLPDAQQTTEAEPSVALPGVPPAPMPPPLAAAPPIEPPVEPAVEPAVESEESDDPEAHKEMPYLFGKKSQDSQESAAALVAFAQPVGDAVVPGGAAQSPDMETLKKYLLLREQDVAALSSQLKTSREQITAVEERLEVEKARSTELEHMLEQHKRRLENFDQEKSQALETLQSEINELRFQMRAKGDKAISLEAQVKTAADEIEQIKKRVRVDIRKIRMREKELENKLEIMKKDSEALIGARETKIIELKRKLDLLEFNMDLLQDQYSREKDVNRDLKVRLGKASQAMKVAGGLLDVDEEAAEEETGATQERKAV